MAGLITVHPITGTSPAAAGTAAMGSAVGLAKYDWIIIDAQITGATGGTLDLVLQRKIEGYDIWVDWVRFPQAAAGAGAAQYHLSLQSTAAITAVDWDVTATPTAATIAANTTLGGHPGNQVRLVATAGASTSAGATQTVYITGWQTR